MSVTATFTGAFNAEKSITAHEYSGVDPANPVDVTAATVSSSSNASSGSVTTRFANDLIFGAGLFSSPGSTGSGFTAMSSIQSNVSEDRLAATAGSYAATFSNSAQIVIAQMVAFKATAAAAPDTQPLFN